MSAGILLEQASPNRGNLYSRRREERLDLQTRNLYVGMDTWCYGVAVREDNRLSEERMGVLRKTRSLKERLKSGNRASGISKKRK